jgi:hypothetical protein
VGLEGEHLVGCPGAGDDFEIVGAGNVGWKYCREETAEERQDRLGVRPPRYLYAQEVSCNGREGGSVSRILSFRLGGGAETKRFCVVEWQRPCLAPYTQR